MATQLVIRYGNTKNRFVSVTQVQVTVGGTAQTELKGSKRGEHHFDVSASLVGSSFEVLIRIPSPPPLKTVPFLLEVKQNMEVFRLASGVISLRAHPTSPGNRFAGGYHPRLEGHLANSGAGHLYYLDFDNTFIPVDALAPVVPSKFSDTYRTAVPLPAGPPAHYNTKLFLFEYTPGRPALWPVLVPPAVKPDRTTVHAVVFFRPKGDTKTSYTNIDDANSVSFVRYVCDPVFGPFFVVQPPGRGKLLSPTQRCGFERQVSEANQPVIFVTPQQHLADYGDAANTKWPTALKSLITALWAQDSIGGSVATGLKLGKTAVAGFSGGGGPVFGALSAHPTLIDELYLFDTEPFDPAAVRKWFQLGGKRLRMVGGGFKHKPMLDLEAELKTSAAITRPATLDAWGTDRDFVSAVSLAGLSPSSIATAPANSLSALTGVFLVSRGANIGIELQGRSPSGTVVVRSAKLPNIAEEEFSAQLAAYTDCFNELTAPPPRVPCRTTLDAEFKTLNDTPPVVPIASANDFNRLIAALLVRVQKLRHQWAVVGGRDSTGAFDRGTSFRGFLQIAIEAGSFP